MRLYGISVEAVVAAPAVREVDERGNARLVAAVGMAAVSLLLSPGRSRLRDYRLSQELKCKRTMRRWPRPRNQHSPLQIV
jgi:hypothetical protein